MEGTAKNEELKRVILQEEKELEKKGLYKGFCLRPDTSNGIIKMYYMNNKIYDVYFDEAQAKIDKIIEWVI